MAHTQEPWGVNDLAANNADVYLTGLDGTKSPLGYIVQTPTAPIAAMIETKANARLIAAAPQMYVALQSMVLNHAQFGRVTDEFVRDVARLLQEIDG